MPIRSCLLLLLASVTTHGAVRAHHSFAAEFDYDLIGTISGVVVEALYVNPHARYFVQVVDEDGHTVTWDAQTRSISALTRAGWTQDVISVGDRVELKGNLGLNDTRKIWILEATLSNGKTIQPYVSGAD